MLNRWSGEVVFRLHMVGDRVAQPGIDTGYGVEAAFDGNAVDDTFIPEMNSM
jgi:hypothetical protein